MILAYHSVNRATEAEDPDRLVLSPELFEAQVNLLRRNGYRFVTMDELLDDRRGAAPPPRTAILTFDDGWLDGLTVVLPMLRRLGLPATFNVCPGMWGVRHDFVAGEAGRLLDRDDALELARSGMELGSHTMSHPDLRALGDDALRAELTASKAAVEELTERPCRTLAYPFGLFDDRVERAAAAVGYEAALAWQPGGPWRPLAMPRMPGPPRHGAGRLALKLLGLHRRKAPSPPED